jgi:hypothetical protein
MPFLLSPRAGFVSLISSKSRYAYTVADIRRM